MHAYTQRDSTMQGDFQKVFRKLMEDKLATRPHIAEKRTSTILSLSRVKQGLIRASPCYVCL